MKTKGIVTLIFAMTCLMVSTLQIYIPIAPQLTSIFSVSKETLKVSFLLEPMIAALIGIPAGYLSDRYGRRPCLIFGIFIHISGSFVCMSAPDISVFFLGRALQAMGVGTLIVVGNATLSDLFQGVALARVLGLFAMLFPLTIATVPIIGAHVYTWWGWRAVFATLLLTASLLSLVIVFLLPETSTSRTKNRCLSTLWQMASTRTTLLLALTHTVPITVGLTFTINAPFLYQTLFQFTPVSFSFVTAIPVVSQITGALIYQKVITRLGLKQAMRMGLFVATAYSGVCLLMIFRVFTGPWTTVGAVAFFALGNTFLVASAATLLLSLSTNSRGLTVSFLNMVKNLGASLLVTGTSLIHHRSFATVFGAMLVLSLIIQLLVRTVQKLEIVPETRVS